MTEQDELYYRGPKYGVVWTEAVRDKRLTTTTRLLYANLCTYVNAETGTCFPGIKRLAEDLGVSERTVKRSVKELLEHGWISKGYLRDVDPEWSGNPNKTYYVVYQSPGTVAKKDNIEVMGDRSITSVTSEVSPVSPPRCQEWPPNIPDNIQDNRVSPNGDNPTTKDLIKALAEVVGYNLGAQSNWGRLGKPAKELLGMSATPELVSEHYGPGGWWYKTDWRGKKGEAPTPNQVIETWGRWELEPAKDEWYDPGVPYIHDWAE